MELKLRSPHLKTMLWKLKRLEGPEGVSCETMIPCDRYSDCDRRILKRRLWSPVTDIQKTMIEYVISWRPGFVLIRAILKKLPHLLSRFQEYCTHEPKTELHISEKRVTLMTLVSPDKSPGWGQSPPPLHSLSPKPVQSKSIFVRLLTNLADCTTDASPTSCDESKPSSQHHCSWVNRDPLLVVGKQGTSL